MPPRDFLDKLRNDLLNRGLIESQSIYEQRGVISLEDEITETNLPEIKITHSGEEYISVVIKKRTRTILLSIILPILTLVIIPTVFKIHSSNQIYTDRGNEYQPRIELAGSPILERATIYNDS